MDVVVYGQVDRSRSLAAQLEINDFQHRKPNHPDMTRLVMVFNNDQSPVLECRIQAEVGLVPKSARSSRRQQAKELGAAEQFEEELELPSMGGGGVESECNSAWIESIPYSTQSSMPCCLSGQIFRCFNLASALPSAGLRRQLSVRNNNERNRHRDDHQDGLLLEGESRAGEVDRATRSNKDTQAFHDTDKGFEGLKAFTGGLSTVEGRCSVTKRVKLEISHVNDTKFTGSNINKVIHQPHPQINRVLIQALSDSTQAIQEKYLIVKLYRYRPRFAGLSVYHFRWRFKRQPNQNKQYSPN
jgi:hypothetical protein